MIVVLADPRAPGPADLLAQHHALMRALFNPGENHFLDGSALTAADIRFVTATQDGAHLGCGAIVLRDGYAEVKSMFTAPDARGKGVADAILRDLIDRAAVEGRPRLRLETGRCLDAAHRLYRRHSFVERDPFGDYAADPASVFFERSA